ncbi:MAG: hypothetical protein Tsb0010_03120 [Parvularculaceae bacterium]
MNARMFIAEILGVDPSEFHDGLRREDCAQWDSFAHLNLMLALEREFGVPLNDETIARYQSLEAIDALFAEKGAASSGV